MLMRSFSKYFSMTGWRIGWMVLPPDLVRPVECLAQNLFISAPYISQVAAEAAFDCQAELQANVARYSRSGDHLLAALPEAGFSRLSPAEGAFYLFADISDRSNDSAGFWSACWRRPASRSVRASTSTAGAATGSCGSATAGRRRICGRRRSGCGTGGRPDPHTC
jgi:aspartate/methionine/tyrosine aminotransferase